MTPIQTIKQAAQKARDEGEGAARAANSIFATASTNGIDILSISALEGHAYELQRLFVSIRKAVKQARDEADKLWPNGKSP